MSLNANRYFNPTATRNALRVAEAEEHMNFWKSRAFAPAKSLTPEQAQKRAHRRMRRYAETIGLAYWPGLIQIEKSEDHHADRSLRGGVTSPEVDRREKRRRYICDPAALVAAEQVLARQGKAWTGNGTEKGGWDSMGVWGLNGDYVAAMWFAAGCEDNRKFRLQVWAASQMPRLDNARDYRAFAKKGDTLPWLRNYYRGLLWLVRNNIRLPLSRKTIAALGRLSAPLRRAAVTSLCDREWPRGHYDDAGVWRHFRLRIDNLDWESVRRAQEQLNGGSVRAKAALVGARAAAKLLAVDYDDGSIAGALAPAFPTVTLAIARRLALGESPVQIAGGALTRAEAHEWLSGGAQQSVEELLSERVGCTLGREIKLRSVRVLRWLETVAGCARRRESLTRMRTAQAPGGQTREFSALDILDEIQDADIVTGKDSVTAVLERAAQRLGEAWMSLQMQDFRPLSPVPTWAKKLPHGVRLLNTPAALATEGKEMNHCVGGYSDAVSNGQSHILAINCGHGRRSTVELSPAMAILQHKAQGNGYPARQNHQLLQAFLNRLRREAK